MYSIPHRNSDSDFSVQNHLVAGQINSSLCVWKKAEFEETDALSGARKREIAKNRKNTHRKHSRICLTLKRQSGLLKRAFFPIWFKTVKDHIEFLDKFSTKESVVISGFDY